MEEIKDMVPEKNQGGPEKRLLITGGAGFLGSSLAAEAAEAYRVSIFDDFSRDSFRFLEESVRSRIEVVRGNVLDRAALSGAARDADVVVHRAAFAGVSRYYEKPFDVIRVNLGGTLSLLETLTQRPPRRLVYISTSEVYGTEAQDASEDRDLRVGHFAEPRWTYAISKIAGEKACLAWGKQHGADVVCLRPFNVFGPGQTGEGAVRDMILAAIEGRDIVVHGDGTQVRAWCFVDDFVKAARLAMEAPGVSGEVVNVGNPKNAVSAEELAKMILKITGSSSRIRFEPHFGTDIRLRTPNVEKAEKVLGFSPGVSLGEGLETTVEWYRNRG